MKKKPEFRFKNAEGVKYRVAWRKPNKKFQADGLCYNPNDVDPRIFLNPDMLERRSMAVIIEEFTHAFFFEKREKEVRKFSATLRNFLYKKGWRKTAK